MKKITLLFFIACTISFAQNTVTVEVGASPGNYIAFNNIFANPADPNPDPCGTGSPYCFGQFFGVPEAGAVIGATDVTLNPNTFYYLTDDGYWRNQWDDGLDGNKIVEANIFFEPGTLNGQDLTFTGEVLSNTIDAARYDAKFFIKALDPDNGFADTFNGTKTLDLPASGTFSVSALAAELGTNGGGTPLIIQYGFQITGLNANPADDWGSVVVAPATLSTAEVEVAELKVYPNPSVDGWNIASNNQTITSVQLFDVLGKQVMTMNTEATEVRIEASELNSGLYFARVNTANGSQNFRLLKE